MTTTATTCSEVPTGRVVTTDAVPEHLTSGLPVTYSDTVVKLSKEEAVQLAAALRGLFQRGLKAQGEANLEMQEYFLMVAMLPLVR